MTGSSFDNVLQQLHYGKPVVAWTTVHYGPPNRWEYWMHGNQRIKATMESHTVVLVGFDKDHVYVNDPLTGRKAFTVKRTTFERS